MKKFFFLLIISSLVITACNDKNETKDIYSNIPSLEELSGIWVSSDTAAMEPSIRNFRGVALLNRDMTSLSWFVSAPYSGGYHTGTMQINGKTPMVEEFRWQPYQALRKGTLDRLSIKSSTRMLFNKDAIMWQVDITNNDDKTQNVIIKQDFIGFISKYGGDWQWWYPYPKMNGKTTIRDQEVENVRKHIGTGIYEEPGIDYFMINGRSTPRDTIMRWPMDKQILACTKYNAEKENNILIVRDTETDAVTAFKIATAADSISVSNSGGTAYWNNEIAPGETKTIKFIMAYGDDKEKVEANISQWADDFDAQFASIENSWNDKWKEMFHPGNDYISGCFPILETDDCKAMKVYYTSPLTMLYLTNTNLPQHQKVFLTGGPKWGASILFFWDITMWSTLWASVDPANLKDHVSSWIKIDPSLYYGQDNFGGKGVGNGYSANYWAIFQILRDYINVTRDFDFLDDTIEGKTILEHMYDYSMNWKNISIYGQKGCTDDIYKLADFGNDEWNLLECVPTYKHIVPSFNVGYAWMMRETAKLYQFKGNSEKANELNAEADSMIQRILKLYAGNGVWYSLYPDNKKVEVRHCLDFSFFGKYIPNDIPPKMKDEMMDFVERELLTDNWMRAQSLLDVAAEESDRCDHGPFGAYDGWPADIMAAFTQLGYPQKALDFYRAIEPVTNEGTWSQSHELWGENKNNKKAQVRIAERGWHARDAICGVSYAQVMLKDFFGFNPDINGNVFKVNPDWQFNGKMYHVFYGGEYYTIEYKEGKPVMIKE